MTVGGRADAPGGGSSGAGGGPGRGPRGGTGGGRRGRSDGSPGGRSGGRLAETVSEQIERDVIDGGWPVGEVLGSEPELIDRYGVSRAVFREAARLVEHHQIAKMKRGPGGGLVVTEPDPGVVRSAARLYLRRRQVTRHQLFEARTALELAAVRGATEGLTHQGAEQLGDALEVEERLIGEGVVLGHTRNLHAAIAGLADNPAIELFVEVLAQLDEDIVHGGWEAHGRAEATVGYSVTESHRAHVAIVEAIVAGEPALAERRMLRHLEAIAALLDDGPPPEPASAGGSVGSGAEVIRPAGSGEDGGEPAARSGLGPLR